MVTLSIRPWVVLGGILHTGTNWQIASDIGFTDIQDELMNSSDFINVFYSNVMIPLGETYYVRSQRILDEGTLLPWSDPVAISNTYDNNAILSNDIISIDKPSLSIDPAEIYDNLNPTISVTASNYSAIGDGHYCTHWFFLDENNKIVWNSVYDKFNLSNIIINKSDISMDQIKSLTIKAFYATATGIISDVAEYYIDFHIVNFNITNDLDLPINANQDYIINFAKPTAELNMNITGIYLYNGNNTQVFNQDISADISSITIPAAAIAITDTYTMNIYFNEDDKIYYRTYTLTVK